MIWKIYDLPKTINYKVLYSTIIFSLSLRYEKTIEMDELGPTGDTTEGFVAKLTNVKLLQQIFKTISLNDDACFYAKKDGLKMTVEAAKTFQANAFIQCNLFNEFQIAEDADFGFNVSLSTLLECLSIFGSSAASAGSSTLTSQLSTPSITRLVLLSLKD